MRCPFGLEWDWFIDVWEATDAQAQFAGGETLSALAVLTLGCVDGFVAMAAGIPLTKSREGRRSLAVC
jgi:hypothetical protein